MLSFEVTVSRPEVSMYWKEEVRVEREPREEVAPEVASEAVEVGLLRLAAIAMVVRGEVVQPGLSRYSDGSIQ